MHIFSYPTRPCMHTSMLVLLEHDACTPHYLVFVLVRVYTAYDVAARCRIDAYGVPGDVRKFDLCCASVDKVVAKYGRIDFLINNAAGNFMVSAENLTPNGLATVLGIDLQGCFHMAKAVLPHMKVNGPTDGAAIINISATLQDQATPFQLHASAAKAGIDVLTNTLAVEWGEYGIRCVGLAPGGIAGMLIGQEPLPVTTVILRPFLSTLSTRHAHTARIRACVCCLRLICPG